MVVGQPNFNTGTVPTNGTPSATTMSGPQGVWIQNGKLYVADTQNNRVLIYNKIPTTNGAAADVVLGQPNFTTFVQVDITQQNTNATAQNMLNPVSVTSDGTRLFVTDLGYNRILIWNSIPTTNAAAADVEIGQPDMDSGVPNNAFTVTSPLRLPTPPQQRLRPRYCARFRTEPTATAIRPIPRVCNFTLNFPRFALSDGTRLFVADGGNDRVLEYEMIPTQNAAGADIILGQIGGTSISRPMRPIR